MGDTEDGTRDDAANGDADRGGPVGGQAPRRIMLALGVGASSSAAVLAIVSASSPSLVAARPDTLLGVLFVALGGAVTGLARAWTVQSRRLMEAERNRRTVEARAELDRAREAERAHEARNALTAIEGATRALQTHTDRMAPGERAALSDAVSTEIARLQQLVAGRPAEPEYGRFRLVEAIAAVVTCERWLGAAIEVDVPDDLVAIGSPTSTAEVVQNLLQNARRHGSGPVHVWAELDDAEVVLRVRDHGPGIPADDADVVFERGGRAHAARRRPGSGLGLHVARELIVGQGGRLWLEDRGHDGQQGACFALALPGFAAAGTLYAVPRPLGESTDQPDDRRQIVQDGPVRAHAVQ